MKKRPEGFLDNNKISHMSEHFNYINELHEYLWRFVRCTIPGACGHLGDHLDKVIDYEEMKREADD